MVNKNVTKDMSVQLQLDWPVSVQRLKYDSKTSFIRVDSDSRSTVQEAGSSVCGFSLQCRVKEKLLPAIAAMFSDYKFEPS